MILQLSILKYYLIFRFLQGTFSSHWWYLQALHLVFRFQWKGWRSYFRISPTFDLFHLNLGVDDVIIVSPDEKILIYFRNQKLHQLYFLKLDLVFEFRCSAWLMSFHIH